MKLAAGAILIAAASNNVSRASTPARSPVPGQAGRASSFCLRSLPPASFHCSGS